MKKGLLAMLVALACATTCAFALPACDDDQSSDPGTTDETPSAGEVAVQSIALDKSTLTLKVGDEETLTATVAPDDATDKTVTWSSDNTAVATVANGKVTAVAAGTATITAKAGEKSATCSVTVNSALTEDTDFDALVSDKVTEDGWKAAFSDNAFENVTIKFSSSGDIPGTATLFKYGTTMCITMKMESGEGTPSIYIFEKDGEKYGYAYNEVSGWLDTGWFTDESLSDDLLNIVSTYRCILPDFGENFDSFTYDSANGAYILKDTIIQNYLPIFFDSTGDYYDYSNISIKIKENQIACFKAVVNVAEFTLEFEHHIYNYGTTEALTIPSEIEDMLDPAKVNGKTFVFSDMTSEDIDAATLEEQIAMSKDTEIVFGGTDTFTITSSMLGLSVVQKGTFSQSGKEIELTITETTVGGQPVEGTTSSKATFDGEKLYITVVTPAGTVTSIYVLMKN